MVDFGGTSLCAHPRNDLRMCSQGCCYDSGSPEKNLSWAPMCRIFFFFSFFSARATMMMSDSNRQLACCFDTFPLCLRAPVMIVQRIIKSQKDHGFVGPTGLWAPGIVITFQYEAHLQYQHDSLTSLLVNMQLTEYGHLETQKMMTMNNMNLTFECICLMVNRALVYIQSSQLASACS